MERRGSCMTDLELRANAMLSEKQALIVLLSDRCAVIAADLAQAQAKLKELTPKGVVLEKDNAGNPTV